MTDKRDKALEWIERQIRQARQALGRAEYKPGVKPEELENLSAKIELLEFISGEVLKVDGADGWTSVKDRLPEDCKKILVVNGHGYISISSLWRKDGSKWTWVDSTGHFNHVNDITHWMPLPLPPEGE